MNKEAYIRKLYETLRQEQLTNEKWIVPEYKDNLNCFIHYMSEQILGKELSDLVYDVAFEQCDKAYIKDKEYSLTNIDELMFFIKEADFLEE